MRRLVVPLFLLLLAGNGTQARDPFRPPAADCFSRPAVPSGWQLLGVIGHRDDFTSRWQSAQGKRLTLRQRQRFVQTNWRVIQIDINGVILAWKGQCRTFHYFFSLKKGRTNAYIHAGSVAATDAKHAGSGADGFADIQPGAGE
ncbi:MULTISPECIES: HofP DNA utilization family protein [unclassified Erwinia]|uniref:HofP DNA utilization family protein n=1 Tax=unclassified Erwinia TaxID=2622719 RepID=UPI000C1A6A8C